MDGCEPGHDWRAEQESTSYVRYRCGDCGSVCVAPKPVEERALVVPTTASALPDPDSEPTPVEAPPWASVASSTSAVSS